MTIINFKDKIYVCGGFDGTSRHSTMEFYDQNTDKWTLLDSTSVGREGAGLVSLGDCLYCIGKQKQKKFISKFFF